jgi:hypothetical protein
MAQAVAEFGEVALEIRQIEHVATRRNGMTLSARTRFSADPVRRGTGARRWRHVRLTSTNDPEDHHA